MDNLIVDQPPILPSRLTPALKEWAVAVAALLGGETILLLRKGGLREAGGEFRVEQQRVWLYPTDEHPDGQWLKPDYAARVMPKAGQGTEVEIGGWAEITHAMPMGSEAMAAALVPFLIWNEAFVAERYAWKPRSPLVALVLRVYALPTPVRIPVHPSYGGCRSWIELQAPLAWEESTPVLSEQRFQAQVGAIATVLDSFKSNPLP